MEQVYMMSDEPNVVAQVARELVSDGVDAGRMRVFSAQPERAAELPVKLVRYRSPPANMAYGTLLGAAGGAVLGLPLMLFGGVGVASLLAIIVAVAAGGALSRLWFGHGLGGALSRLDAALRQGQLLMVIELDKARVAEVEQAITSRHPQVAVLGTDVEGTPPFP
jgi:hypothetical protein